MGHNHPPEPTAYEVVKGHIEDLYNTAKDFLDGAPVDNAGLAGAVELLEVQLKASIKRADEARKAESKKPNDEIAEIQSRYNPLIGNNKFGKSIAILGVEACQKALLPWRKKELADKEAAAKLARAEAEAKAEALRAEQEKAIASQVDTVDLAEQERLSKLADDAQKASRIARSAEKSATTKTGIRTTFKAVMVEGGMDAALTHVLINDGDTVRGWLQGWADLAVRDSGPGAASMNIPGFEIKSIQESR